MEMETGTHEDRDGDGMVVEMWIGMGTRMGWVGMGMEAGMGIEKGMWVRVERGTGRGHSWGCRKGWDADTYVHEGGDGDKDGIRLLWRLDTAGDGDRYWGAIGMETGMG